VLNEAVVDLDRIVGGTSTTTTRLPNDTDREGSFAQQTKLSSENATEELAHH
jgi:hypothetical protein